MMQMTSLNRNRYYEEETFEALRAALLAANFYVQVSPRWPVETKVYPIEDEE